MRPERMLSAIPVAGMLISVHHGTGFVVAAGEQALRLGGPGSLCPGSAAPGIWAILLPPGSCWTESERTILLVRLGFSSLACWHTGNLDHVCAQA